MNDSTVTKPASSWPKSPITERYCDCDIQAESPYATPYSTTNTFTMLRRYSKRRSVSILPSHAMPATTAPVITRSCLLSSTTSIVHGRKKNGTSATRPRVVQRMTASQKRMTLDELPTENDSLIGRYKKTKR